ncbi:MAG TPA: hypothetical protein VE869_07635 [Gemmatimonas sp.]|nr:hypothetical protein [Gemmatimonas sp.]
MTDMRLSLVRFAAPLAGAALALLSACGPSDLVGKDKLEPIKAGMRSDSVAALLGAGPLKALADGDSVRLFHGYRTQTFAPPSGVYRVVWYRDTPGSLEDQITRETETPILMNADTVMGAGWSYFDEKAEELGLPNPYRSKDRLDSIAKSQQKPN